MYLTTILDTRQEIQAQTLESETLAKYIAH